MMKNLKIKLKNIAAMPYLVLMGYALLTGCDTEVPSEDGRSAPSNLESEVPTDASLNIEDVAPLTLNDFPLITANPAIICNTQKFYDRTGTLTQGTKICDIESSTSLKSKHIRAGVTILNVAGTLAECNEDGEVDCISNESYIPVKTEGLAEKVIIGYSAAGIAGKHSTSIHRDCTFDGQVSCLTTSIYRAAQTSDLASKLLSGHSAAGQSGTYTPDFPDPSHVLKTDTVDGVTGTLTLPDENQVRMSIVYGVAGKGSTGAFSLPTKANVASGLGYGSESKEVTGTLVVESHTDCNGGGQSGCLTNATYVSMDLSNKDAGGAVDLTSSNFNTRLKSSSTFEYWDKTGKRHTGQGDANMLAPNIKSSISLFGTSGSLIESPADCLSEGSQGCVATGSYYAAKACDSSGDKTCYVSSGSSFDAADLTGISADNIKSGITISSVAGNLTLPASTDVENNVTYGSPDEQLTGTLVVPDVVNVLAGIQYGSSGTEYTGSAVAESHTDCTAEGQLNCVTTSQVPATEVATLANKVISGYSIAGQSGAVTQPPVGDVLLSTSYGVPGSLQVGTLTLPLESDVLTGSPSYGQPSALKIPTYTPDYPDTTNVLSSDTTNSVSGTLVLPSSDNVRLNVSYGSGGSGSTGSFTLPAMADVDSNASYGAGGSEYTGTLTVEAHTNCTGAGQTGCVATSTYRTMDLTNKDASGAFDLTSTAYDTRMKSSATFEYWDALGARHIGTGDSDLIAANIRTSSTILDITGSLVERPSDCSSDGAQSCIPTGSYYAASSCSSTGDKNCFINSSSAFDAANFTGASASNIRSGVTIGGISGTLQLPAIADVRSGVTFDSVDALQTGTFALPSISNVASGIQYGSGGNEFTGAATVETHTNCSAEGQTDCVTTSTYPPTEVAALANKVLSGQSISGVAGTATLPAVGNVLSSTNYGVPGSQLTGTLSLPLASNVLSGSGLYGRPSAQITPSYSPDYPDVANVLNSDTTNLISGTLTLPTESQTRLNITYGAGGNGSTGDYALPATINVDSNTSYGTGGTEYTGTLTVEMHSNCTGPGQVGCVTTSTYKTMDLSNKDAGGALNLTSTDYNTRLKSSSTFEYWDASGTRHTGTGDTDLIATNVKSTATILDVTGTLVEISASNCSADGSQNCIPTGSYYAATSCSSSGDKNCFVNSSSSFDSANFTGALSSNIKSGITIGGIAGSMQLPAVTDVRSGITFGSVDDLQTGTFIVPAISNVATGIQFGSSGSEFTGTAVIESHTNCSAEGQTNCITTTTFSPTETALLAPKVLSGQSIASVSGTATLPAVGDVLDGTSYGIPTASLTGTLILPSESNVLTGSAAYGNPSAQRTPSYVPDFPAVSSVLSTDTVNGSSGTLTNRGVWDMTSAFPGSGYYTGITNAPVAGNLRRGIQIAGNTGNYPSATSPLYRYSDTGSSTSTTGSNITDLSDFSTNARTSSTFEYWNSSGQRLTGTGDGDLTASNIKSSVNIHGINGTLIESPADCSSSGSQNCVATGSYYAASACSSNGQDDCYASSGTVYDATDFTNLTAGNIKSGVTIAGVTGAYPSVTYPLPLATRPDLTASTFNSKMVSGDEFEYWTSSGSYQTGTGDTDIVAGNIRSGVTIFGVTGIYTGPPTQPTGLSTTPVSTTQIDVSWNDVSVTGYLLIVRENAAVTFTPVDGTSYGTGFQGSDEILYVGTSTSYSHSSGVSVGNTYYYSLYSYDSNDNYSAVTTTSGTAIAQCGGSGDSCYDDATAMSAGVAVTPLGKSLEYVYSDGSSGFQVWKEQGGSRILKATGLDEWSMELNSDGKSVSSTAFTSHNIGSSSTYIAGRVCPPNVYLSNSNKFSTNNCLYYSPAYNNAPEIIATSWDYFHTNASICGNKSMRMPTIYETTVNSFSEDSYISGNPTYAGSAGVPSGGGQTWTATSDGSQWYWNICWSGSSVCYDNTLSSKKVVCVVP